MAKRGNRFQLFSKKGKSIRREFGRPELDWAVGDDTERSDVGLSLEETPKQFELSSDNNTAPQKRFKVEASSHAIERHTLIEDEKSAAKFSYTKPDGTNSIKSEKFSARVVPTASLTQRNPFQRKAAGAQDAVQHRPLSAPTDSSSKAVAPESILPAGDDSDSGNSSTPDVQPTKNEESVQTSDWAMYAPGSRRRDSSYEPGQELDVGLDADTHSAVDTTLSVGESVGAERYARRDVGSAHVEPGTEPHTDLHDGHPPNGTAATIVESVTIDSAFLPDVSGSSTTRANGNGTVFSPYDPASAPLLSPSPKMPAESGIRNAFSGPDGAKRVDAIRSQLEKALEAWWGNSQLPSTALLRDGLLVLESGHSLEEVHRTLLLRTSLAKRRGMLTALRHQLDPDRSAFLIKDSLLDEGHPLTVSDLEYMLADYEPDEEWAELLADELQYDLPQLEGKQRSVTLNTIAVLNDKLSAFRPPPLYDGGVYDIAVREAQPIATAEDAPVDTDELAPLMLPTVEFWNIGRLLLVLLLAISLFVTWRWLQGRTTLADMVTIPAGAYLIADTAPDSGGRLLTVSSFVIDRTEVTNESYQLCFEQGVCGEPLQLGSESRSSYFLNPTFHTYPVVHVDWHQANTYCDWAGKRLPTDEEWQIAASSALASERYFQYPWGDRFSPLYANGAESGVGDTQQIGLYFPVGASPAGAEDMAGNVAEWTATVHQFDTPNNSYAIKGGSYNDSAQLLSASQRAAHPADFAAAWLGFRCAKSVD